MNSVEPLERASAVALGVFSIHILGDAISPWLIGVISDATSLANAVLVVPAAVVVCALIWAWAARASTEQRAEREPHLGQGQGSQG
jgi:fucose permease